jgi:hypothetical protein
MIRAADDSPLDLDWIWDQATTAEQLAFCHSVVGVPWLRLKDLPPGAHRILVQLLFAMDRGHEEIVYHGITYRVRSPFATIGASPWQKPEKGGRNG